jgi:3-oxo-5alpha-steroid 4-dehydrogenase
VRWLLTLGRVTGPTLEAVARRAGVDPDGLAATAAARSLTPPYSLIDVSVRNRPAAPAPMLTLGGLRVDEQTGQALRPDGRPVDGLYAAGRTAAGICSRSYVSGLSLADCVFSGRRAGRHAAVQDRGGLHAGEAS